MTPPASSLDRREFIRVAGLLAASLALPACVGRDESDPHLDANRSDAGDALVDSPGAGDSAPDQAAADLDSRDLVADSDAAADADVPDDGSPDPAALPTLGGAPDTHEGRVIAAFVDTVVPGRHRDPLGRLGGIDVGAPGMFFDPELPALPFVSVLVIFLDSTARSRFRGRSFDALSPGERDQVLVEGSATLSVLEFAVQLAKLAFFSSPDSGAELGYPGPNAGYVESPSLSFNEPITTEITSDGNYP